ncbi:cyanophycinase, partial [bacterium]
MKRAFVLIVIVLLALPLCAGPGPKGYLFIVGGGDWPDGMVKRF